MDLSWAEKKLEEYLKLCDAVRNAVPLGEMWNDRATSLNQQAELMLHTIERIVRWIDPSETEKLLPPAYSGSSNGEQRVRRALGAVRDLEEVEMRMTPTAPGLAADTLHPVVWQSAAVIWGTGQYRVAIGQASLALATHIKARATSKLSDRKLVQEVFSPAAPTADRVRLVLNDVLGSDQFVPGLLKVFMERFSRVELRLQVKRRSAAHEGSPICLQRPFQRLSGFNDISQSCWQGQDFCAGFIEGSAIRLNCLVIHRPIISSSFASESSCECLLYGDHL